jgi:hypothetical protein
MQAAGPPMALTKDGKYPEGTTPDEQQSKHPLKGVVPYDAGK